MIRPGHEPTEVREAVVEREVPPVVRDLVRPEELPREVRVKERTYRFTEDDLRLLVDLGRFRMVEQTDLAVLVGKKERRLQRTFRSLEKQGLLSRRALTSPQGGGPRKVAFLTRTGREVLTAAAGETSQRFYSGFVKKQELAHELAVYRMYQLEAERIRKEGGTVCRVQLDHELKRRAFSFLEKARLWKEPEEKIKTVCASVLALTVDEGKLVFPDLRLEYQTASGERSHVDLELSTEHYKTSQRAAKARAGFRVYHLGRSHLSGTPHGEEILRGVYGR